MTVEEARPGEEAPPMAFRIDPGDGRFTAAIAPTPLEAGAGERLGQARELAERSRLEAEEGSAERELALRELRADGAVRGYWFASSDRELTSRVPSEGEWRGRVSGAAVVGELLLAFTLLDDLPGHHRAAFLGVLATARHLPPLAAEPEPAPDRFFPGSELVVALPDSGESMVVRVPSFQVTEPMLVEQGRATAAYARDPASGIGVAVVVRRAERGVTPQGCRERVIARLQGTGSGLRGLSESSRGDAALAVHETGEGASRWHSRAWFARDGLCVELHLSVAGDGRGAAALGTLEPILGSVRFSALH